MAIKHLIAGLSVAAATLVLGAQSASACDCHEGPPACEAFWRARVVFVGHVESVVLKKGTGRYDDYQIVRFRVTEGLRGNTARTVDLTNGLDNCSFQFTAGEDWLIYAFPTRDGIGLSTFLCAGSRPLKFAARDLEYARSVPTRSPDTGRIFGRLVYVRGETIIPVTGARISLSPPGTRPPDTSLTDGEGHYEIAAKKGMNNLAAELPRGMSLRPEDLMVELLDSRGCAERELWADYPGRVSGRVVDRDGLPVPNLPVEILRANGFDPNRHRAMTDRSGRFNVSGITPGDYLAGVVIGYQATASAVVGQAFGWKPRYFYLGGATTERDARGVQIEGDSHQVLADLILPKTTTVAQVAGLVVHSDGRPAANVEVRAKADYEEDGLDWTTIRSNDRGRFVFALPLGTRYRIVAQATKALSSSTPAITIDPAKDQKPLRLVIP